LNSQTLFRRRRLWHKGARNSFQVLAHT
jgi:hypothetical protein